MGAKKKMRTSRNKSMSYVQLISQLLETAKTYLIQENELCNLNKLNSVVNRYHLNVQATFLALFGPDFTFRISDR